MGPAADVYALVAMLYEVLTGRPPFRAASAVDTMLQVVMEDPVRPTQLQSSTPRIWSTICLKCLQKDPLKRYAGALELAAIRGVFRRTDRSWPGRRPSSNGPPS